MKNKGILKDVYDVGEGKGVRCYCNGGYQDTKEKGTLPGFGKVWYNPTSLANILSFAKVSDRYRITIDTDQEQAFTVHINGFKMKFVRHDLDLYYHDLKWNALEKAKQDMTNSQKQTEKKVRFDTEDKSQVIMVNTVIICEAL